MDIIDKIIDEEIERFLKEERCWDGYQRNYDVPKGEQGSCEIKKEAAKDAGQHVANKAVSDKTTNAEALKGLIPELPDNEIGPWLERHGLEPKEIGYRSSANVDDTHLEEDKPIHTAVKLRIAEVDGLDEKKKKRKKRKGGKRDGKGASSKGYSLRDWFKGGGWVQTGGKYDGKPCAKQPGQKTKPYCRDPDDRAKLSKKDRDKRARKKRREDPNPNRRGKAKNVTQKKKGKKK
ncbi:MAG: hypothetical protein VYD35_01530 [Actinomycetota bacterium]|nr:hypothetical protein [Actinomycetota bacterium]